MNTQKINELEKKIVELRQRIPPHSIPPAMLQELEELEDAMDREKQQSAES